MYPIEKIFSKLLKNHSLKKRKKCREGGLAPVLFSEPNVGSPAPQHRQVLAPSFFSGLPTCPEGGTSPHCEQLETSPLFCGDNRHPAEHVPDKPLQGLVCSVPKA